VSELSEMKPNLVDRICKLDKSHAKNHNTLSQFAVYLEYNLSKE